MLKEKFLYDNQNAAMVCLNESSWIKYGFVKQYGGFNRLAQSFTQFEITDEGDVKGYDRAIDLHYAVQIRNFFLECPFWLEDTKQYVTHFTLNPLVICPDGVVRERQCGNISGSNNTTSNNCIAHLLIFFRFLVTLYFECLDRYPTYEELMKNHKCAIYSDDNFSGHNLSHLGCSIDRFREIKKKVYLGCGLTLKEEACITRPNVS